MAPNYRQRSHPSGPPPGEREFRIAQGTYTHELVAEVARRSRTEPPAFIDAALRSMAAEVVSDAIWGRRTRTARLVACGQAAIYKSCFLPPQNWILLGTEVEIEGGRLDALWEIPEFGGVLYDEVKTSQSLRIPTGPGPTAEQVARYVDHGVRNSTPERPFIGVRLLFLASPGSSRLVTPTGSRLLSETEFWFEARLERARVV
jgi:hypothetical protein